MHRSGDRGDKNTKEEGRQAEREMEGKYSLFVCFCLLTTIVLSSHFNQTRLGEGTREVNWALFLKMH